LLDQTAKKSFYVKFYFESIDEYFEATGFFALKNICCFHQNLLVSGLDLFKNNYSVASRLSPIDSK